MNGAQAEGCSPVATAFAAGQDVCRPVKPDTIAKSLAIGNPADGPYALDLARRSGGWVDAVSERRSGRASRCSRRPPASSPRPPAASRPPCCAKLAARGDIDPDERVVLVITGEGLKTLDAVRGTFETYTIAADARSLRGGRARARVRGLMTVVVKIPTQLRAAAGGEAEASSTAHRAGGAGRRCSSATASCARASPTRTARCAASSTSTSPAKTSASSTACRRRWPTAPS